MTTVSVHWTLGVEPETGDDGLRFHLSESAEAEKRPLLRLKIAGN